VALTNDYFAEVRKRLLEDATVSSLVGGRVYEAQIAEVVDAGGIIEYPCVNFAIDFGLRDTAANELVEGTYRIWTWSNQSYEQAFEVYDAVYAVLHRIDLHGDTVHGVQWEIMSPLNILDKDNHTYGVVSRWTLRIVKR